jgi:hypothetical protein
MELQVVNGVSTLSVSYLALQNNLVVAQSYEIPTNKASTFSSMSKNTYEAVVPQGALVLSLATHSPYESALASLRQEARDANLSISANYSPMDLTSNLYEDISSANSSSSSSVTSSNLSQMIGEDLLDLYTYQATTQTRANQYLVGTMNSTIAKDQGVLEKLLSQGK